MRSVVCLCDLGSVGPGARSVLLTGEGRRVLGRKATAWFPSLDSVEAWPTSTADGKQLIWGLLDIDIPIVC